VSGYVFTRLDSTALYANVVSVLGLSLKIIFYIETTEKVTEAMMALMVKTRNPTSAVAFITILFLIYTV